MIECNHKGVIIKYERTTIKVKTNRKRYCADS